MLRCTVDAIDRGRNNGCGFPFLILLGRMAEIRSIAGPSAAARITILCAAVCY